LRCVIRIDVRIVPRARHGDVREPSINEGLSRAADVDVDQDAVGRVPLAAVAGDGVPVVEMVGLAGGERQMPSRIERQPEVSTWVDPLDRCELTIRDLSWPVRRGELDAVRSYAWEILGSGTGIRTPVPWLRTTCPDP
jgi:hypothetical protein